MKEAKTIFEKNGFDYSKLLRRVLIGVIALAIFIVLMATGQILFILQIFGWIENKVRVTTGLDMLLVKGITAILMSIILILPIGGFILSFFPVPQKNKKIKRFTVFAIFALLFFAVYLSSTNVYFNPNTGQPLKYYSITTNGEYNFYSSNGYDPVTGDKLLPVNKEVVAQHLNNKSETNPKSTEKIIETIIIVFILGLLITALFFITRELNRRIKEFKASPNPFKTFKKP